VATGYMTLPVPVLGNLYAAETVFTLNQYGYEGIRSTPGPYWAVLWNRCLSIIDNHDHSSTGIDVGEHGGKKILWGSDSLSTSVGSVKITSDISLETQPGFDQSSIAPNIYALVDLSHFAFSYKSNIVNEIDTLTDSSFTNFGPSVFPLNSPQVDERYRLYSRLRYGRITYGNSSGTDTDNYTFAPSISLVWNNGNANEEGTVLVHNEPPGDVAKWWRFSGPDDPATATTMLYHGTTNQPYQGILDRGEYGGEVSSVTLTAGAYYPTADLENSVLTIGVGAYVATPRLIWIKDYLKSADPKEYPDQNEELLFNEGNPPSLWRFFAIDTAGVEAPTVGRDQLGFRVGKMMWVWDQSNTASTYNIQILLGELQTVGAYKSNEDFYLRWYDSSTASFKSAFWNGVTPDAGNDDLLIDTNDKSILLVKASRLLWFAYFV